MIIVLEGADGTGKTTLAHKLADHLGGAVILRRATPVEHVLREYTFDRLGKDHIICDRWHYGELVYGPMFRGRTQLHTPFFIAIDQYLAEVGALLVLVDGQAAEIRQRLRKRGGMDEIDTMMMGGRLDDVLSWYDEIFARPQVVRKMRVPGPVADEDIDRILTEGEKAYAARNIQYD